MILGQCPRYSYCRLFTGSTARIRSVDPLRVVQIEDFDTCPCGGTHVSSLGEPTDRAILRFDLGSDDLAGTERFGERLEPGDVVELSVVTADGVRTSRTLVVPDPLPSGAGVSL